MTPHGLAAAGPGAGGSVVDGALLVSLLVVLLLLSAWWRETGQVPAVSLPAPTRSVVVLLLVGFASVVVVRFLGVL